MRITRLPETLGLVKGNTIRARHIGKDILAGLRGIVGGEIEEYTKVFAEAREQAIDRLIQDAKRVGADGIVCMRLTTSTVMQGAAELLPTVRLLSLNNKSISLHQ